MHKPANDLPIVFRAGDAHIRSVEFGDFAVNIVKAPKGTDFGPLLEGLPANLCQCPHWGYLLSGAIHIRYSDDIQETIRAGEVFYWPAGHTGWVDEDTAFLELSPKSAMRDLIAHFEKKTAE